MALHLHLKRAKLFALATDKGHKEVMGNKGDVVAVPDWVAKTDTFKLGVKDGSIIDTTPAHIRRVPIYDPTTDEDLAMRFGFELPKKSANVDEEDEEDETSPQTDLDVDAEDRAVVLSSTQSKMPRDRKASKTPRGLVGATTAVDNQK
jgi:hypothetical protein